MGGLLEKGRGLFNLEKTTVSVVHKELGYKVEKFKNKKVGGHALEDQNQIQTSSWWINHPGSVHTKLNTAVIDYYSLSLIYQWRIFMRGAY